MGWSKTNPHFMTKNSAAKAIMAFSLLGVLNGSYLTYIFWKNAFGEGGISFCDVNSLFSCTSVVTTPYAQFFGVPVCTWAIAVYFLIILLAYEAMKKSAAKAKGYFYATGILSGMGLMMNVIYLHNEWVFLNTLCLLCAICLIFITANLIFSVIGHGKSK